MKTRLLSLFLGAFFVCNAWAGQDYSVEVVDQPGQKWQFQRLIAHSSDNQTQVTGRLTSPMPMALPHGHVDVAAYSASGQLLASTTTDYTPAMLTQTMKRKGGVRFTTTFEQALPEGVVIKIAFHRDPPAAKMNPPHAGNIAK